MSKHKRDRVKEITERRKRETDSKSFSAATAQVSALFTAYVYEGFDVLGKEESSHELFKYVPVSLVATIQSYFRGMIAELINFEGNDRYRTNAQNLKDVSLNLKEALAIAGQTITVGEFIAHNIAINNLEDAYGVMTTLVGFNFRKQLVALDRKKEQQLSGHLHQTLSDMFEKRHIICHEHAQTLSITNHDAFNYLTETYSLVLGADSLITEIELDRMVPSRADRLECE